MSGFVESLHFRTNGEAESHDNGDFSNTYAIRLNFREKSERTLRTCDSGWRADKYSELALKSPSRRSPLHRRVGHRSTGLGWLTAGWWFMALPLCNKLISTDKSFFFCFRRIILQLYGNYISLRSDTRLRSEVIRLSAVLENWMYWYRFHRINSPRQITTISFIFCTRMLR